MANLKPYTHSFHCREELMQVCLQRGEFISVAMQTSAYGEPLAFRVVELCCTHDGVAQLNGEPLPPNAEAPDA